MRNEYYAWSWKSPCFRLEQSVVAVEASSGIETFHGMDNQVEVVESSHRIEEVRWYCRRLHGLSARRQILTLLLLNVAR